MDEFLRMGNSHQSSQLLTYEKIILALSFAATVHAQDTNAINAAANRQFVLDTKAEIKTKLEVLPYKKLLAADTNIDSAVTTLFPNAPIAKHYRLLQGVWMERANQCTNLADLQALDAKLGSTNSIQKAIIMDQDTINRYQAGATFTPAYCKALWHWRG